MDLIPIIFRSQVSTSLYFIGTLYFNVLRTLIWLYDSLDTSLIASCFEPSHVVSHVAPVTLSSGTFCNSKGIGWSFFFPRFPWRGPAQHETSGAWLLVFVGIEFGATHTQQRWNSKSGSLPTRVETPGNLSGHVLRFDTKYT